MTDTPSAVGPCHRCKARWERRDPEYWVCPACGSQNTPWNVDPSWVDPTDTPSAALVERLANTHDVPWNELAVTVDDLPHCIAALRQEPAKRHPFLLRRLVSDLLWRTGMDRDEAAVTVAAAALAAQPGEREQIKGLRRTVERFRSEGRADDLAQLALGVIDANERMRAEFEVERAVLCATEPPRDAEREEERI